MAEVLGLGVTHYPQLGGLDADMAAHLRLRLRDTVIPPEMKDPKNWPAPMREEWGDDQGVKAAARHRARMLLGLRKVRAALDEFGPDFVLIWGDDQYENFQDDIIPPFCVYAYDQEMTLKPWAHAKESSMMDGKPNIWNEPADHGIRVKFHCEAAKHIATKLLESEFDAAYAYRPLHHPGLPHSILNSILYLDYDRSGFAYPLIPFQINCYGELAVSYRAYLSSLSDRGRPLDPPAPSPKRCFDLGAATARICRESPWRVALVASSSWSHAFLNDKTWRLQPDIEADRRLYKAMISGDYEYWTSLTLRQLSDAGQQELLNWYTLVGGMSALGQPCTWADMAESYVFNSCKVSAVFSPNGASLR